MEIHFGKAHTKIGKNSRLAIDYFVLPHETQLPQTKQIMHRSTTVAPNFIDDK